MSSIWQVIRLHYGFQSTGSHFLDFNTIVLQPDERPEDLYQRLMSFIEDNLLSQNGHISHHGIVPSEDEELTPSLENMVVLTWIRLIHPDLPQLVKQHYGTELRSTTLASLKPEISLALDSLLDEVNSAVESKVFRTVTRDLLRQNTHKPSRTMTNAPITNSKLCPLCSQANRPNNKHFLSKCPYLPVSDKRFMNKARQASCFHDEGIDANDPTPDVDSLKI
ncbi:hypothetical protein LOTGIDRAFT_152266 [Lottia gigantea]|uniref:Uncharacterized protein n=1 Tax=Lottia gigantea TaxID=225164 RepID=V4CSC2_LOTGI|nr:hypothetical protein LOTGIDRAFT_152266 [Lottia gigantea]ESP05415.1 hypothetical protein LOTGIDRAFT_152266 [Lottia gigantea]